MAYFVANPGGLAAVAEQAEASMLPQAMALSSRIQANVEGIGGKPPFPYTTQVRPGRVVIQSSMWHWLEYGYMQFGREYRAPAKPIARAVQDLGMRWEDAGG